MALTEHQQLNTAAASVDVQVRYFGGISYSSLIKSGLSAVFNTWTAPDTGKPAGWTEITSRVSWQGQFVQRRQGASITFEVTLRGSNYNYSLLGMGQAIVAWRRVYRPTGTTTAPAGWQAWQLEFVGMITVKNNEDDYRHGKTWTRTITGQNAWLDRYNAPRLTAGKINLMTDASVSGSDSLPQAQISLERDSHEFVGGSVNVEINNIKDNNRSTVYISQAYPGGTVIPDPGTYWDGGVVFGELFVKPVVGWPGNLCWWLELYDQRVQSGYDYLDLTFGSWNNGSPVYWRGRFPGMQQGQWAVVCGNKQYYDMYNGGANGKAAWVVDASTIIPGLALDPNDGMIFLNGSWCGIAWAPNGAVRTYEQPNHPYWSGWNTLDSTAIPAGSSWVYDWSGVLRDRSHWSVNPTPHPGGQDVGSGPIWIKVLLPENVCKTQDALTSASTVIRLDKYTGWVTPPQGQVAYGIVASKRFQWTSRDAAGLKGVTWIDVPSAEIPSQTQCYPYANGMAQTGYPLVQTSVVRRKQPAIAHYQVYWSQIDARTYMDAGWQSDYYGHNHETQGNWQTLELPDLTADNANAYLWVRSFTYLIYRMSDGGRGKVNEILAELAQTALDFSGFPNLDGRRSYDLAAYVYNKWSGLPLADFVDASSRYTHFMGQHAFAITPVSKVYDDLAKATGCLVWYAPDGHIYWLDDPAWPFNYSTDPQIAFDASTIRGTIKASEERIMTDYVILNALSIEGDPHPVRYIYPQPGSGLSEPPTSAMTTEINDLVIARDGDAQAVAARQYMMIVRGNNTATLVVKGTAEWARPGLRVLVRYDLNGDGYAETTDWLIESVTVNRAVDKNNRSQITTLALRSFLSDLVFATAEEIDS